MSHLIPQSSFSKLILFYQTLITTINNYSAKPSRTKSPYKNKLNDQEFQAILIILLKFILKTINLTKSWAILFTTHLSVEVFICPYE